MKNTHMVIAKPGNSQGRPWFPSPCGEKVMKNPILTETLLHLAFKEHLRQATETKM